MRQPKIKSPFPTSGYFGPEYFCDRHDETDVLKKNIESNLSTTLVSIRRMGKTGLVKHVQNQISDKTICIYADILPTENSVELTNSLSNAIINAVPAKTKFHSRVWKFIQSLRPVVSYDALTGMPNVSFNIQPDETKNHIGSLFEFLEKQEMPVLFAIDEFQQILNYPEKRVDAWLRTLIQQLKNVTFIFSGSQKHLMNDLFSNPDRPFYRSTSFLSLNEIDFSEYQNFILQKFTEKQKNISLDVILEMLTWTNVHTYYVQLLCNRVFVNSGKKITSETWKQEAIRILNEQEYIFYNYRELLSKQQWNLLKAIAAENKVFAPTSKNFINDHNLGSPATVRRSLEALHNKELVYKNYDSEGNLYYSIYDVLFKNWIQKK